ncbi:MAG: hypothetical protein V4722_05275 [Bacteroidota bacterium]
MGKVYKVRWTLIAAEEFEEAINWLLENWNEKIAADFITSVTKKIELVQKPFGAFGRLQKNMGFTLSSSSV